MKTIKTISDAITAVDQILDSVIPELEDIAEYSKNELRSAKLILKDAAQGIAHHHSEFSDYLETYHEITRTVWHYVNQPKSKNYFSQLHENNGTGAIWIEAQKLTDQFQKLHSEREWDGEFYDEIDNFISEKAKGD